MLQTATKPKARPVLIDQESEERTEMNVFHEPTADQLKSWFCISALVGVFGGVVLSIAVCNYDERQIQQHRTSRENAFRNAQLRNGRRKLCFTN